MSKCMITGKTRMKGNKISHSNVKTKCQKKVNIKKKRIYNLNTGEWNKLTISTRSIKTLNKKSLSLYK